MLELTVKSGLGGFGMGLAFVGIGADLVASFGTGFDLRWRV
jgi:hypothetical protein